MWRKGRSVLCLPRILNKYSNNHSQVHYVRTFASNSSTSTYGEKFYATKPVPKKLDWDRAVSDAERLVGYQTSFLSLRWLLSDEIANIAVHLRKLVGRNHPLLKTAKFMLYNEKSAMQAWGLIVLLVSKAAGYSAESIPEMDQDKSCGLLYTQRALAEVTEMIRVSHLVHNSLVNLQTQPKDETGDIIFGNKISLLTGDYLLGHASLELANLRNQDITGVISSAIRDFTESEFIGDRDNQNNVLPSRPNASYGPPSGTLSDLDDDHFETDVLKPIDVNKYLGIPEKEWEVRHLLHAGHLLARSCQGALNLAKQPEELQKCGFLFGKHLSLAWQACLDYEPFRHHTLPHNTTFNLIGAPVLFHLSYDPSSYEEIEKGKHSIESIDFAKLHSLIRLGPGLKLTKDLQLKHTRKALKMLEHFPQSDARTALENILVAMQDL